MILMYFCHIVKHLHYYKPKALQMSRFTCIKHMFLFCNAKLLWVICVLQVPFLFVYSLVLVLLKSSNRSLVSIFNSEFNHFFLKLASRGVSTVDDFGDDRYMFTSVFSNWRT